MGRELTQTSFIGLGAYCNVFDSRLLRSNERSRDVPALPPPFEGLRQRALIPLKYS